MPPRPSPAPQAPTLHAKAVQDDLPAVARDLLLVQAVVHAIPGGKRRAGGAAAIGGRCGGGRLRCRGLLRALEGIELCLESLVLGPQALQLLGARHWRALGANWARWSWLGVHSAIGSNRQCVKGNANWRSRSLLRPALSSPSSMHTGNPKPRDPAPLLQAPW